MHKNKTSQRSITLRVSTDHRGPSGRKLDKHEKTITDARVRVGKMDAIDGSMQCQFPVDMCLRTIMEAILCGLTEQKHGAIEDAYVMLEQLERFVRVNAS